MIELDKDNYDQNVLNTDGICLVDFWSESCEDCMDILPDLEEMEEEFSETVLFGKVNIKGNRRLAIREKVLGLPSVLIYKNGQKEATFSKEFTSAEVRNKLREVVGA